MDLKKRPGFDKDDESTRRNRARELKKSNKKKVSKDWGDEKRETETFVLKTSSLGRLENRKHLEWEVRKANESISTRK